MSDVRIQWRASLLSLFVAGIMMAFLLFVILGQVHSGSLGRPGTMAAVAAAKSTLAVRVGQLAPDFTLPDQNGKLHKLSGYRGSWVLLYFYPKDFTAGCTTEACSIRDAWAQFKAHGAVVLGVSIDPVQSHQQFAGKYALPFTILSDTGKKVVKTYGVWGARNYHGHQSIGTLRTSFLINPKGVIARIYENVQPNLHVQQVLNDLAKLQAKG